MTHAHADPLVGRTVAHYEITARLGGGGMGVVYKALDRKLGRPVALKFLPQEWSHDESARERFVREAQAASATHHPNICTIHDVETADDGQLFIVMAYYEGETLKRRLEAGPLPIEEALDIATQVADGLARAHAQGVVHRDIKPGNLILTEDGVRIVDFGLATLVDALQITTQGSTLGTAAYMSPEQVKGEQADARSDVWALGIVLYEMLVGHVPFRGSYAEAIGYAIRNEPPPPLRAERPEIPEEVEQLVFRALHKDPAIRFATGREFARALRAVRGLTVPQELRTEAVVIPVPARTRRLAPSPRRWIRLAVAAALLLVAAPAWLFLPAERVTVAVAPVVNGTGESELDAVRLALTNEFIEQLADSPVVRVIPYSRLLQATRRFRHPGEDPSSGEALRVLKAETGPQFLAVPTLVYQNGAWSIRVDYRDAATSTSIGSDETGAEVSSLGGDTTYRLTPVLARRMQATLAGRAPLRTWVMEQLRTFFGRLTEVPSPRLRNVRAAVLYEQGRDAYEQQEFSRALQLLTAALEHDQRSPILQAWRSRTAMAMRQDEVAAEAAETAARLVSPETATVHRLLIAATLSEARGDAAVAEAAYRELVDRFADEPEWLIELAAFQDRQLRTEQAIATYHEALAADARLVRPHLELCRLYSPGRQNDPANARQHGETALARYRELGGRAGEAHALWCLADVLRVGDAQDLRRGRDYADRALGIFRELQFEFNLSRAYNYAALAAASQGQIREAITLWEAAFDGATRTGNRVLEPLALMNLGVAHQRLGDLQAATDYSGRSAAGFERLGQQKRAAEIQVNRAQLVLDYGGDVAGAVRDVQNALAVFRKYQDRDFEVFCLRLVASALRYDGRYAEADRQLLQALSTARQYDLRENTSRVLIARARLKYELGEYAEARDLLGQATALNVAPNTADIAILRARVHARLREFDAARTELEKARAALASGGAEVLLSELHVATGELEFLRDNLPAARSAFERAARAGNPAFPDDASVEARAYLGLIHALTGSPREGRTMILASVEHARRMQRHALAARGHLFLARAYVAERRTADARRALEAIPADDRGRTVGTELRTAIDALRSGLADAIGG